MWLNSPHLLDVISSEVSGWDANANSPAALSTAGMALLDYLDESGLTTEELFSNPRLVASIVLAGCESEMIVVPTEEYFYFELYYRGTWIAGNLRTCDADLGVLHCGYYFRSDPQRSQYAALGTQSDLCVTASSNNGYKSVIVHDDLIDKEVTFKVMDASQLPFVVRCVPLPGEALVSPVIDESGAAFFLMYDSTSCRFLYVLASLSSEQHLVAIDDDLYVEPMSGFVYYRGSWGRLELCGVNRSSVAENTFYDGPFDQVPPRLGIRPLIQEAFSGIEMAREDWLDEHGNWTKTHGMRVAISPYFEWHDGEYDVINITIGSKMRADRSAYPIGHDADGDAWLQSFADVVNENAKSWPAGHDLFRSAASKE